MYRLLTDRNDKAASFFVTSQVKQTPEGQVHLSLRTWGVTKKRNTLLFLSAFNWYILIASWLVFYFQLFQEIIQISNHSIKFLSVKCALLIKCANGYIRDHITRSKNSIENNIDHIYQE